jgi:hypothetical protein
MEVLLITVFISLLLALTFLVLFFIARKDSNKGLEQEALRPLVEDEFTTIANAPKTANHLNK